MTQEAREAAEAADLERDMARRRRELERKRKVLEVRIEEMRAEFQAEQEELAQEAESHRLREEAGDVERTTMRSMRAGSSGA